jgi:signal transduction histidine kinase
VNQADALVLETLQDAAHQSAWLWPSAVYLLRDLTGILAENARDPGSLPEIDRLSSRVSLILTRTERVLSLAADYATLGLASVNDPTDSRQRPWVPYGTPMWLVGAVPAVEGRGSVVVAFRAEAVLGGLEAAGNPNGPIFGEVAMASGGSKEEEPLGSEFPGLVVQFSSADGEIGTEIGSLRWWFYSVGLLLVIGVTLFGAYLLWRDTRREVQLAETRSRFVSAVSHELKTPLTAIRMFAETLHEGGAATPEAHDEYLETIVNESERLTRLLNNVLDFSKIERGGKTYHRELQGLDEIVRFSARAMRYPLEQRRFSLGVEIEENLPPVRVDRDAIEQAILNLLANAMKYSGDSRDIQLRLRAEDGEAVIEVSDQGIGIEPGEEDQIFERFYRAPGPEYENIPGTGLGLTLVHHIAQGHDGRITVKSAPGEGSTFSLRIPLNGGEA